MVARAPDTSVELTRMALELSESVDDMALPGLADVFATLAVFYARGNRRDDASVFAERAVRLLRTLPQTGETRLRLAGSLGNYASLLDQSGERQAAIEHAREACALAEQCVAEGVAGAAPVLWQCVFNLALDLLNDGQAAEAHQVAENALRRVDSSSADEASWAAQLREISAATSARGNP
jgi:tetratricopeptide (TPR) repeat protein